MIRLAAALICVFALTPTYAQDWTPYKEAKQANLKPTKIGEAGNGTFTLEQAIVLIGKETGNPVEPDKVTAAPEETRDLVLQGLSFWEAIKAIEGQWKLDAAILRRAWDRGVTPPQPLQGEVIQERIVDCFRITMTVTEKIPFKAFKGPDGAYRHLMVQLESEPRLPLFAAVKCKYDAVDTAENTAHQDGAACHWAPRVSLGAAPRDTARVSFPV